MRTIVFVFAAMILFAATPAMAAKPVPGDACANLNYFTTSGGSETGGIIYFLVCDGSHWQPMGISSHASTNTGFGYGVLYSSGGSNDTAVGDLALTANTSGTQNTGIGVYALGANTNGAGNTATGYFALRHSTSASNNSAFGINALSADTTGGHNTAVGYEAIQQVTTGTNNIGIGYAVGSTTLSTGSNNILIGTSSAVDTPLSSTTNFLDIGNAIYGTGIMGGTVKIGIGTATPAAALDVNGAIRLNDLAQNCSHATDTGVIRYNSTSFKLQSCRNGVGWTDVGAGGSGAAGSDQQVQLNNNGVLYASSGFTFNSANGNLSVGNASRYNTGVGISALTSNTIGTLNAAFGNGALYANTTGNESTAVGNAALALSMTGGRNTSLGSGSEYHNIAGNVNVSVGYASLYYNQNGSYNVGVGMQTLGGAAGSVNNQSENTAVGANSGGSITTGGANALLGYNTGYTLTTGSSNAILGPSVASTTLTTGSSNILIGTSSAVDTPLSSTTNFLDIGNAIYGTGIMGGTVKIGIGTATPGAALDVVGDIHYSGLLQDVSDRRAKDHIQPLPAGQLAKLMRLQPVSFVMKADPLRRTELGLIAQDTEPLFPELVQTGPDGMKSMGYVELVAPLIKAVQEQQAEIDQLRAGLAAVFSAALLSGFLLWRNRAK